MLKYIEFDWQSILNIQTTVFLVLLVFLSGSLSYPPFCFFQSQMIFVTIRTLSFNKHILLIQFKHFWTAFFFKLCCNGIWYLQIKLEVRKKLNNWFSFELLFGKLFLVTFTEWKFTYLTCYFLCNVLDIFRCWNI